MRVSIVPTRLKKLVYTSLGLVCLALGIVGYVLPGLPGTIFLIIAASLFVRSSDRLYNFVVQNKLFGRQVKEFLESGAMPLKAKITALISIWIFSIASVFLAPYILLFHLFVLGLAVIGTIYIVSRPTKTISHPTEGK